MRMRTLVVAILAMVCGVSAAVGVNYLRAPVTSAPQEKPEVTIIPVAAVDIKRGTTVTEDMITEREWPKGLVPQGTILKKEDIVNQLAQTPMYKDAPIFVGSVGDQASFSGLIRAGMRAYTILTPNDASLVAGFVEPGDKVDILFTDRQSRSAQTGGGATTPLLQNIEVLAVGQIIDPSEMREKADRKMRSVTLLVTLDIATKLALAQEMGTLHLALRSGLDQSTALAAGVTMKELMKTAYPALFAEEVSDNVELVTALKPVGEPPVSIAEREFEIRTLRGPVASSIIMQEARGRVKYLGSVRVKSEDASK